MIIEINNPQKFPPVPRNSTNTPGVPFIKGKIVGGKIPIQITNIPIIQLISGTKIYGIKNIGLNKMGIPTITGMYSPKIDIMKVDFAILLKFLFFTNKSMIHIKAITPPDPEINPKLRYTVLIV